jgi:hypothetical protein
LYLTVALDESVPVARDRLRTQLERWYNRPFEQIASLQATYAGTPEGLRAHIRPYVDAGAEHIVLRIADQPARGLDAAAHALEDLDTNATPASSP